MYSYNCIFISVYLIDSVSTCHHCDPRFTLDPLFIRNTLLLPLCILISHNFSLVSTALSHSWTGSHTHSSMGGSDNFFRFRWGLFNTEREKGNWNDSDVDNLVYVRSMPLLTCWNVCLFLSPSSLLSLVLLCSFSPLAPFRFYRDSDWYICS